MKTPPIFLALAFISSVSIGQSTSPTNGANAQVFLKLLRDGAPNCSLTAGNDALKLTLGRSTTSNAFDDSRACVKRTLATLERWHESLIQPSLSTFTDDCRRLLIESHAAFQSHLEGILGVRDSSQRAWEVRINRELQDLRLTTNKAALTCT